MSSAPSSSSPSSAPSSRPMAAIEWAMMIALSALWGGSFFFNGLAIRELPPLTIVCLRMVVAATLLHVVLSLRGQRLPSSRSAWSAFFGMSVLNNVVPFVLIVWAQGHLASGVAAILNATTPLFTIIVAHIMTSDEKMTGGRLSGVLIGLAGVAVMIGGEALRSLGVNVLAQLACLAAAIFYAFSSVFGRRFRALGLTPIVTATGQVTASTLILLPLMLFHDQPWTLPMPGWETILALFAIGSLSTALAYILFFRILASAGAMNLMLVTFLIPVSAILLGIAFLGETLLPKHLFGMAMIGLGLAAIDGRPWRWLRGPLRVG